MKQGRLLFALTIFSVIFPIYTFGQPNADVIQQSDKVGRFQLFQGTYTVLDGKNNRADKDTSVFLIDTASGKVFRYATGLDSSGKYFEYWQPTTK